MVFFAGTSFVVDVNLYLCIGKVRIREFSFSRVEVPRGGGGLFLEQKEPMKSLRLELVLIDYLNEKGALMMKLDQLPG